MLNRKMLDVMADVNDKVAEREELVEALAVALLTRKNLFILGDTGQAKSYAINLFRRHITGARQFERLLSKQCDEEQLFGRLDLSSLIPGNPNDDVLAADPAYQSAFHETESAYLDYLAAMNSDQTAKDQALEKCDRTLRHLELCKRMAYVRHGVQPKLITTGKIPDSHIAFVDEVFKANDGVLNSLLTALNERRYTNEGQTIDIPTISFFGASNEIPRFSNPEDQILKPLYDRFELKVITRYVESRDNRLAVLRNKQSGNSARMGVSITLDELYAMQEEVAAVQVPDAVNELMDDILCELRGKGIHISDRKYFGYYPIAQARAWLCGRSVVEPSDLTILRNYLWTAPEELEPIRSTLERMCNDPLQDKLDNALKLAVESFDEFTATNASDPARRIGKLRGEFMDLYEHLSMIQSAAQNDAERRKVEDTLNEIEGYSQKAHDAVGFSYVPLKELYAIKKAS